jgi:hypothetical protein
MAASTFFASVFRSVPIKRGRMFTQTMMAPSDPNT